MEESLIGTNVYADLNEPRLYYQMTSKIEGRLAEAFEK